jgi:small subunit ribosomal protein S16
MARSMLKIRLQRIGRRNQPYYRLIVTDSKFGPKSGRFIEIIGSYDPKGGAVNIKTDRAEYWMNQGAQASDTAHNFLVDHKVIDKKKINALPKKTAPKKEEVVEEPAPNVEETPAEAPADEVVETPTEETPEVTEEAPVAEEVKEETPAEEATA